ESTREDSVMAKGQTVRARAVLPPPVPQAQQEVAVALRLPGDVYELAVSCHPHDEPGGTDWPFDTFLPRRAHGREVPAAVASRAQSPRANRRPRSRGATLRTGGVGEAQAALAADDDQRVFEQSRGLDDLRQRAMEGTFPAEFRRAMGLPVPQA